MCPHVSCDRATLRKLSVANVAVKRLFPAVCSTMCCQVGGLAEGFVALDTSKIFDLSAKFAHFYLLRPVGSFATVSS